MAEYTIDKFTYDGNTYKLKSSTLKNLVDGSQTGSVRGTNTIAEGSGYTIGYSAFVEGVGTRASGDVSHAEGVGSVASGSTSHAEGNGTTASGSYSHAEGDSTTASNSESHAEGSQSTASGATSHAEGKGTNATGQYSHAEGYYNTASGLAAHAEGNQTTANHAYQHVFGSYNVADNSTATATNKGNYIEIVGKGTSNSARANARTLDWSGNEVLAGKLTLGAVGVNSMDAATVGQIPSVPTRVSDLTNDAGYITGYTETDPVFSASAAAGITATNISNWNSKQAVLVSGTNIKTINNESILGSGDITIQGESYTATSPIAIDENNDISHENSGVTAGTYTGSDNGKSTIYMPSFTVDAEGHITAASSTGFQLSTAGRSSYGLVPSAWQTNMVMLDNYGIGRTLTAGQTTDTVTITVPSYVNAYLPLTVCAFDSVTKESVMVDYSFSTTRSEYYTTAITVTISIATTYEHNIKYHILEAGATWM